MQQKGEMKKVKAVIKEQPSGTQYDVYKRFLFFWIWDFGYKPLSSAKFLIDENIQRLKQIYGEENVLIDDRRIKAVV